jgi:ATP synthase protein I
MLTTSSTEGLSEPGAPPIAGLVQSDLIAVTWADVRLTDFQSAAAKLADLDAARSANARLMNARLGASTKLADVRSADLQLADLQSVDVQLVEARSVDTMVEYYQLQQELLVTTLILSGLIFPCVWLAYTQNIALNYLLGACTGVVYLKLLARNVERIGSGSASSGKSHLAVFGGVMIVATQWNSLHVLPVFLGFLTFKITLLLYTLRILLKSSAEI